jgi:hypothetical protein
VVDSEPLGNGIDNNEVITSGTFGSELYWTEVRWEEAESVGSEGGGEFFDAVERDIVGKEEEEKAVSRPSCPA